MTRAVRIGAAVTVAVAVAVALRPTPHRHMPSAAVASDPTVAFIVVTFVTALADLNSAHREAALTRLAAVTAPALLATIRATASHDLAPRGVRVVDVASVGDTESVARAFVIASLTSSGGDGAPLEVGYLLTLRRTATGWQVTGVTS